MAISTHALLLLLPAASLAQLFAVPVEVIAVPGGLLERSQGGESADLERPLVSSWSSSSSSSSSWERGADGKLHERVQQVQEESGDGHHKKAAIACIDGHCKGVAAGPDRKAAIDEAKTLANRVLRRGRGSNTESTSAKGLLADDMDASFAKQESMFDHVQRGMERHAAAMQRDMQDMMRPMQRMFQPVEQMMQPAEQMLHAGRASPLAALRRGRGTAGANHTEGARSESRSYSYSSDGDQAVVQTVSCKGDTCVQTTKHYGGEGTATSATKPSLAKPEAKPKDVPFIEVIQKE